MAFLHWHDPHNMSTTGLGSHRKTDESDSNIFAKLFSSGSKTRNDGEKQPHGTMRDATVRYLRGCFLKYDKAVTFNDRKKHDQAERNVWRQKYMEFQSFSFGENIFLPITFKLENIMLK